MLNLQWFVTHNWNTHGDSGNGWEALLQPPSRSAKFGLQTLMINSGYNENIIIRALQQLRCIIDPWDVETCDVARKVTIGNRRTFFARMVGIVQFTVLKIASLLMVPCLERVCHWRYVSLRCCVLPMVPGADCWWRGRLDSWSRYETAALMSIK